MTARSPLDITFIGSGNAFADSRCHSGFVVNGHVLFDCPPTALYALKRAGVDLAAIDTIVLSHFHADHYFGLPFLLLEYVFPGAAGGRTPARTRDLTIVGPPGLADTIEQVNSLAFPKILDFPTSYKRHYVELSPGQKATVNKVELAAVRMNHAEGVLDTCLGYRAVTEGRRISYTGDTGWCDGLFELAEDAEVLVTDCNYPTGRNLPEHLSLEEVRDLRARVPATTAMILTHLGHDEAPTDMVNTQAATDFARFHFR